MEKEFDTYPGRTSLSEDDRIPVYRFVPGSNGYARFVTRERFVPPVRVAGWMRLQPWGGTKTPGNPALDGLHIHVGHVGNHRNYAASLIRRDSNAKLAVEYGWQGYTTLRGIWNGKGPELRMDRVNLFEVVWERNHLSSWVANETGAWTMEAEIPEDRVIPVGSVGFRLDNLIGRGDFVVSSA